MRVASTFSKYDERTQESVLSKIHMMLAGPGRVVQWVDQLSEQERAAAMEAAAELEAVYQRLKDAGVLRSADGGTPMMNMLAKGK